MSAMYSKNGVIINKNGTTGVAHDGTMTGDGTDGMPLSIQSALDVSNANTAPKYDPTAIYPKVGTLCTYGNVLYRSKVAINEAEEWTEEHWEVDSVASEFEEVKSDPTWINITNKIGNYDGTDTAVGHRYITIEYSRKLALIYIRGYVMPTASGYGIKVFSFNNDIVPFNNGEYFAKTGRNLVYMSMTPYNVTTDFRRPFSITVRDVTSQQTIEFQSMCTLLVSTAEFDAYLASH